MSSLGNQGYDTLDDVVKLSCEGDMDWNYKTYTPRYNLAMRFMREEAGMRLRVGTNIRKRVLEVGENNRIPFPSDYVSYITVGFGHNGNTVAFAYNPDMDVSAINSCGDYTAVEGGNVKGLPDGKDWIVPRDISGWDGRGWTQAPLVGYGGGYVSEGDYQIDWERREFVFSSAMKFGTIVLEYVSDNFDPDASNLMHIAAIKPCLSYIEHHYMKALYKQTNNGHYQGLSTTAHRRFTYEMIEAKNFLQSSTGYEIIQAFRRNQGGALNL